MGSGRSNDRQELPVGGTIAHSGDFRKSRIRGNPVPTGDANLSFGRRGKIAE
jgi:hypothetical protein